MTAQPERSGSIAADRLKSFIERIEKLIEERKAIQGDIKDVFSEAKGVGFDVPAMRKVITLRAMDESDRQELETLIDTYMHAMGDGKRAAVEAMQGGAGTRAAAKAAGIAVGAASQLRTGVHGIENREHPRDPETGEITETAVQTPGNGTGTAVTSSPASAVASNAAPRLEASQEVTRTTAPQPVPEGGVGAGILSAANSDGMDPLPFLDRRQRVGA